MPRPEALLHPADALISYGSDAMRDLFIHFWYGALNAESPSCMQGGITAFISNGTRPHGRLFLYRDRDARPMIGLQLTVLQHSSLSSSQSLYTDGRNSLVAQTTHYCRRIQGKWKRYMNVMQRRHGARVQSVSKASSTRTSHRAPLVFCELLQTAAWLTSPFTNKPR